MMLEQLAAAQLDSLRMRRQNYEKLLLDVKSTLDAFQARLAEFEAPVGMLNTTTALAARLDAIVIGLRDTMPAMSSLHDQTESFNVALATATDNVEAELGERMTELESAIGSILLGRSEAQAEIMDRLETTVPDLCEKITGQGGEIIELLEDVTEANSEITGTLGEQSGAWREFATRKVEELMLEAVPGAIAETTQGFTDGLDQLRETGLGQLSSLKDQIDSIRNKTQTVTDLAEQAKPVLSLAAQLA